jgi:hypothetical protein
MLAMALLSGGAVLAQQPATRIDTAPLPAEERDSVGSVELRREPVLAKRRYLEQLEREREPDTRSMGVGPAGVLRRLQAREDLRQQRAQDAAEQRSHNPKAP